jgi:hypothetical protein
MVSGAAARCRRTRVGLSAHDFIYGKPSWEVVRQLYEARLPDVSFLDYF